MARVVWMYFQLIPIDATHFQSVDNEIDCDVEFPENPAQMIVKVDLGNGIKIYTLEKILASKHDLLTDYVGTYYAVELGFSYEIYLQDNNLFIKYKGKSPSKLRSISQDIFLLESAKLEFGRDREGRVNGLDRCSDRVRRLHFSKQ